MCIVGNGGPLSLVPSTLLTQVRRRHTFSRCVLGAMLHPQCSLIIYPPTTPKHLPATHKQPPATHKLTNMAATMDPTATTAAASGANGTSMDLILQVPLAAAFVLLVSEKSSFLQAYAVSLFVSPLSAPHANAHPLTYTPLTNPPGDPQPASGPFAPPPQQASVCSGALGHTQHRAGHHAGNTGGWHVGGCGGNRSSAALSVPQQHPTCRTTSSSYERQHCWPAAHHNTNREWRL